jgi:DNA-binding SARP family transcriptional activator
MGGAVTLDIRVLGPVNVFVDGQVLDCGHSRQRTVLAALGLDANGVVSAEELIERVWAERAGPRARGSLHGYVSRLRVVLAGTGARIRREPGGYVLDVEPSALDLNRFRDLVGRARSAGSDGPAADLYERALRLWTGPPLGTADTPWLNQARAGLKAEKDRAQDDLDDVGLRLGRHHEMLAGLRERQAADPLDERLTGRLMLALYRAGRQGDALAQYQSLQGRLADELGVDPAPQLQRLHQGMLRAAPALEAPAPAGSVAPVGVWPVVVGDPPPVATAFQPRVAVQGRLAAAMDRSGSTTVITQILSGDGGTGKTQLAAAIFDRARVARSSDLFVWLTAATSEAVITGYAETMARIDGGTRTDDPPAAATRFLGWLRETTRDWLIVLDDVADPAHLARWWPSGPHGRTLLTTRRRDASLGEHGRAMVDVDVYEPAESLAYLTDRLVPGRTRSDVLAGAVELAVDLGHSPLALAQAAAVVLDGGLTCGQYRKRFNDRSSRLEDLFPPAPDPRQRTVAGTWSLAVEAADALAPTGLARPVLETIAVLDPNGVPQEILTTPGCLGYLKERLGGPAELCVQPDEITQALRNLNRMSLITHDPADATRAVRMHAVAQRATREALDPPVRRAAQRAAAGALIEIWPDHAQDKHLAAVLRANAGALAQIAGEELWDGGAHPVLARTGRSLADVGLVREAVGYWRDLTATSRRLLGPTHPHTLATRADLANSIGRAGDRNGAVTEFDGLLADLLVGPGPDHPATLSARGDRARWRARAGDPAAAILEMVELFADRTRLLGAGHRDTLSTRSDLAYTRGQAGDPDGAAVAFEELAPVVLRTLGADDPLTMAVLDHLGRWQALAGDPEKGMAAAGQVFADRQRILGPDHPDTMTARGHLAYWTGMAGHPEAARSAIEDMLADVIREVGPDHPGTLATRANLAHWRGHSGDPAGAAADLAGLVADRQRVLGPDHPDTLISRGLHAHWRYEAGETDEATRALTELLTDQLRVLGPDHPATQVTVDTLTNEGRQPPAIPPRADVGPSESPRKPSLCSPDQRRETFPPPLVARVRERLAHEHERHATCTRVEYLPMRGRSTASRDGDAATSGHSPGRTVMVSWPA